MAEKKELHAVLQGNGLFSKNLYKVLSQEPGRNVFFSPISAHAVLSMAFQGSRGETAEAFSKVLNVEDAKIAAKGYKDVMFRLNNTPDVTLLIANKIYLKTGYSLQYTFKEVITKDYLSEIQQLDFRDKVNAARTINEWVEEKTKDKIKDLIQSDDLDRDTTLVLVNAIYFKGSWLDKFDPKNTKTEKFYLNEQDTIDVDMMFRKGNYLYKLDEELGAQILELPYSNKDLSLTVILPTDRNGIAELEKKLAGVDLTRINEGLFRPEVNVRLPKFKIEQTIDLEGALTKLGLGIIFEVDKADLTGFLSAKEQLYVSKVIQKAFIEVNEEGAEAAAATGMMVRRLMAMLPRPPEEFRADHPFVIVLTQTEQEHAHVLFHGRVSKPQKC